MRILIIASLYYPNELGGAEKSTRAIAESLVKMGYNVTVLTSSNSDGRKELNGVSIEEIKIPHVFWRGDSRKVTKWQKAIWRMYEPFNILAALRVHTYLRSQTFDVVHTNNIGGFSPWIWLAIHLRNIKIVHTARDYYLLCKHSGLLRKKHACNRQCLDCRFYTTNYRFLSKYVDTLVGVSSFVARLHADAGYFSNAEITAIANPIHTSKFSTPVKQKNKTFRLGIFGGIRFEKGVNELLEQLHDYSIKSEIEIFIAGPKILPKYFDDFQRLIAQNTKYYYLGYVEPSEFFQKIDVLLNPAIWHEPFPRTLIEAYSFGVPVIASNKGGTPEAVNRISKKLIYSNFSELINAIDFVMDSQRYTSFSEKALDISKEFSAEHIVSKYLECYESKLL
ncbi:glycosyltransferase [Schleiferiaceae bacterium]|nr:glycosyltransferase [Schleiferiaceae bacterium]